MYKSLFYGLCLMVMASSVMASSGSSLEDGFVDVKPTAFCLDRVFPEKFSADQIRTFFSKKDVSLQGTGALSVDDVFHSKICPNTVQMITGTAASYADKIKFAGQASLENGSLVGLYEYTSSYAGLYEYCGYADSITFPVKLSPQEDDSGFVIYNKHLAQDGRCEVLNLKDSFLGRENDFVSKPSQFEGFNIPEASLFYIIYTDDKFYLEKGKFERLQENAKTYLLMLDQLRGADHFHQSEKDREADAEKLYTCLLDEKGLIRSEQTSQQYTDVMMALREEILKQLGVPIELVPEISNKDVMKVSSGKALLVVPAPETKMVSF